MRLCYSIVTCMALVMLTAGMTVITACGQKGPLYHPDTVKSPQPDKTEKDKKSSKTQN